MKLCICAPAIPNADPVTPPSPANLPVSPGSLHTVLINSSDSENGDFAIREKDVTCLEYTGMVLGMGYFALFQILTLGMGETCMESCIECRKRRNELTESDVVYRSSAEVLQNPVRAEAQS